MFGPEVIVTPHPSPPPSPIPPSPTPCYSHKEETSAHVVREGTHPNVAALLEVFGGDHCRHIQTALDGKVHRRLVNSKDQQKIGLQQRPVLPSQRAMQLRFSVVRNLLPFCSRNEEIIPLNIRHRLPENQNHDVNPPFWRHIFGHTHP